MRGLPPEGVERSREYLDKAIEQTRRIETLVYQMLDASRFQHGQIELTKAEIDLVPLVQHVVENGQALTAEQTIDFKSTQKMLSAQDHGPGIP